MKAMISVGYVCEFKEHPAGNHVIGAPDFIAKIVNSGENPFRAFLDQVEPGCRVDVQVILSVNPKSA